MLRLTLVTLLLISPALAQPMPGMEHGAAAETPAAAANRKAMDKMMAGMDTPPSGDADRDFVAGMLPHHQGAIDMARIELQYGHDPALKQLAHEIIAAQDRERAFMHRWQAQHPAKPAP